VKQILIADDHDVVRSGLRAIVETRGDWKVVAEASNGRDALSLALEKRPDVAIVDYSMPFINGVEVARRIQSHHCGTEVLIFTMHESDELIREALRAGVKAFLLKSDARKYLLAAIESLIAHKPFFTGILSEKLLENFLLTSRSGFDAALSPRERNVIQLIAEGHSNKVMSTVLNLSVKTIETHRASAMRKLNITSTAGVVRYAIRSKLIEP
jgi:DNA-binding NarL/FixJ family response regulator